MLSTSPNETTVASSASEERLLLLWRLEFFRPNVNESLRSQRRFFLSCGEPLVLDDAVHRVSSELTLFVRLKRLGVRDRRGGDVDGGSGGSGRLRFVAEAVRLESMLKNIGCQRKNGCSVATVSVTIVGGRRSQRRICAGRTSRGQRRSMGYQK